MTCDTSPAQSPTFAALIKGLALVGFGLVLGAGTASAQSPVLDFGSAANSSGPTLALTGVTAPAGSTIVMFVYELSTTNQIGALSDGTTNTYNIVTAANPNNDPDDGIALIFVAENIVGISNATLTYTKGTSGSPAAMAALGPVGVIPGSYDGAVENDVGGSSASPSVTMSATPDAQNELIIGAVAWNGTTSDTFTQDSAHGNYAVPFDFNKSVAGVNIAGGSFIQSGTPALATYAPTITSHPWHIFIIGLRREG